MLLRCLYVLNNIIGGIGMNQYRLQWLIATMANPTFRKVYFLTWVLYYSQFLPSTSEVNAPKEKKQVSVQIKSPIFKSPVKLILVSLTTITSLD